VLFSVTSRDHVPSAPVLYGIVFKMEKANFKKDADFFGKMDPFVEVHWGNNKRIRTKTHQDAGKNPVWN